MSTETRTTDGVGTDGLPGNWKAGVAGGLAGGVVFGLLMTAMTTNVLEMAIPVMYGIEGPAGELGWLIHMAHSAILGLVFAAVVGFARLSGSTR